MKILVYKAAQKTFKRKSKRWQVVGMGSTEESLGPRSFPQVSVLGVCATINCDLFGKLSTPCTGGWVRGVCVPPRKIQDLRVRPWMPLSHETQLVATKIPVTPSAASRALSQSQIIFCPSPRFFFASALEYFAPESKIILPQSLIIAFSPHSRLLFFPYPLSPATKLISKER